MENIFVEFLPPWVETGLQPAFYDKESGTVLQQTARMYARVNMLIRMFNKLSKNTKTTVEEYIDKFNSLHDYVMDYFKNLDVQEEINNKLDEMSESGELERIITEYYEGSFDLIFPAYGVEGGDTLGDCVIIKNGDDSMMVDTFVGTSEHPECYAKIREALHNAEISTLSYLVITHYHSDHIGNVLNLLSDGYLAGCTVYLPRVASSYPSLDGAAIKNALTLAGVTWIEIDNQSFTVGDDLNVQMLNGSATDYQYYEDLELSDPSYNNAYNDRSIVCEIEYKGRHILLTGDIEDHACEYLTPKLSYSSYDLIKDCHHGYINNAPDFCAKVNPNYVIIPASIGMVNKNYASWMVNSAYWIRKSKNVAIQGYQPAEMVFTIDILGVHCDDVYFLNNLSSAGQTNYYVDADTADFVRTGSKDHPFKTLTEAIIFLQKDAPEEIIINVLSLPLTNNQCRITGFKNLRVTFANGVIFNNKIIVENCTRVQINNLVQNTSFVDVYNSHLILDNYTNTSGGNAITAYMSKIHIRNGFTTTISTDHAIKAQFNTQLTIVGDSDNLDITFADSTTKRLLNCSYSTINMSAGVVSYLETFLFDAQIMQRDELSINTLSVNTENLRVLYKDSTGTYSGGSLRESIERYNVVTVVYMDNDNNKQLVRVDRWNGTTISTIRTRLDGTEMYIKSAFLTFSGTNFTIARNSQATIRSNGTIALGTGNYVKVLAIYGEGGFV